MWHRLVKTAKWSVICQCALKVNRQQIDAADALYKQWRAGNVSKESVFAQISSKVTDLPFMIKASIAVVLPVFGNALAFDVLMGDGNAGIFSRSVTGLFTGLASIFVLNKLVLQPIKRATEALNAVANGQLYLQIEYKKPTMRPGRMMQALKMMQIRLGFDINNNKKIAEEGLRLQTALDNSTTAFTFSGLA